MTLINITCIPLFTLVLAAVTGSIGAVRAEDPAPTASSEKVAKPVIVLVHGAWADGTTWQRVIPLLEKDGYDVVAVQNSLTSLADDIATTRRMIESQKGPVVIVGHSYGGAVITGAASDNSNVKALVYVSAFAPDANEAIGAYYDKYPVPAATALIPDAANFLFIDRAKFHTVFCADLSDEEARVMAATQKPLPASAFGASTPTAAWKTIPSWYIVAKDDQAISPDLERFYAKRMGAHTTEIKSSHVSYISHPKEVVGVIERAASASSK